jgi:hypothetical protein
LNRRYGRAAREVLSDVAGDCCSRGFEARLAFLAILGKKIEGYLRVENRLLDGAERKQVSGLRFELVDSGLIALRDRRKKRDGDCSRRKCGEPAATCGKSRPAKLERHPAILRGQILLPAGSVESPEVSDDIQKSPSPFPREHL